MLEAAMASDSRMRRGMTPSERLADPEGPLRFRRHQGIRDKH
jgi:hypothetical protein